MAAAGLSRGLASSHAALSAEGCAAILSTAAQHPGLPSRSGAARRFDRTGTILATASRDGTAALWSVQRGELLAVLSRHQGALRGLCFSPMADAC